MRAKGFLWLTTSIWLAIATLLLRDSYLEYRQDELEVARQWGHSIKILIAETRFGSARWFLVGSSLGFATGPGAILRNLKTKEVSKVSQGATSVVSAS